MADLSGILSETIVSNTFSTDISRSRYWGTREGDVRAKILKMTSAKENISFIYKESLRSMISCFSDIVYFTGEEKTSRVKVIHANPERAIAKLTQEDNIILPVISIAQTISRDDDKRSRHKSVLVHEKVWDSEKSRAYRVLSFSPRPVNIQYDINIWSKYKSDMDQIIEQIRLKFSPEMIVPTKYSTLAKAYLTEESDSGAVSAGDKEDRVIQKKIGVTLRTYIPSPKFLITATGKIEELKIEAYIKNPDNKTKPSN